jgi:hypothetical protein
MDLISSGNLTVPVSAIWYKITSTLEGGEDYSGAFSTSDWVFYRNTITKLLCDKFGAIKMHTNTGSVLRFSLDKLEKIHRSYNTEIKIKTTLKSYTDNNAIEISNNYDVNPENDGDGCDGSDGSRDSAHDVNIVTATATSREEISSNSIDKVQGTTSVAVTAVTAVTDMESRAHATDRQDLIPHMTDYQQAQSTKPETIQNAGEIYWSGANWHCRQCRLFGDKFYMEVHICKGYVSE